MKQSKFKFGDRVKVTDSRCIYLLYDEMAGIMDMKNWEPNKYITNGSVATVINIQKHPTLENVLIGIRIDDGKEYIIGEDGLESVKETETSDVIQISRKHLNEYYGHSNTEQRNFINDNFKVDGTTTISALIELERIASDFLKPVIRKNHPECFPTPEFDFTDYRREHTCVVFTDRQTELLGFEMSPIQIRTHGKYQNKGFWLSSEVEWKLIKEGDTQVLVPIKKIN